MRRSRRFVPILGVDCRKKKNVPVKHVLKKIRKFHQLHKRSSRKNAKTQSFIFIREYSCLFVVFATLRLRARERFTEKNSDENYVPAGAL